MPTHLQGLQDTLDGLSTDLDIPGFLDFLNHSFPAILNMVKRCSGLGKGSIVMTS